MQLDPDPRRDRILRAALELSLERSPASVTIQQIRGLSGAATGTIYHHFRDKQGLFLHLFLAATRHYHGVVLGALEPGRCPRRMVRSMVRAYLQWIVQNVSLARFVQVARQSEVVRGDDPDVRDQHRVFVRSVYARLDPWVRSGELRPIPRDMALAVAIGPTEHYATEWLLGRTLTEPDEAWELLADAAWDALRVASVA